MSFVENIIDPNDSSYTFISEVYGDLPFTKDGGSHFIKYDGTLEFKRKNNNQSIDVSSSSYKSWFVTDANNNIIIAVNKSDESMTTARLKFFKCRERLK